MPRGILLCAAIAVSALSAAAAIALAQAPTPPPAAADAPRDPPPPLPPDVLKDPKLVAAGEALWKDSCAHCHGSKAYPGKAPKLQPHKYKAEFVWDRVHNGFKDMPPWKEVYTPEQVISLVAWVKSEDFWP
jgi:mono/diheme cytochrome c family protein